MFNLTGAGITEDVKSGLQATLDRWAAAAVVDPLRTGQPPVGIESLFTAGSAARLTTADRASLVEDPPPLVGAVHPDRSEAELTPVPNRDGSVQLVVARIELVVTVSAKRSKLVSARTGDLVFLPENGAWVIDSYDISAKRDTVA
ncbi:MAG: hypothetical protein LC792_09735 [Actinobacteria bacterium]|nr:hypothetical protein [Actinomycetota bacterium]